MSHKFTFASIFLLVSIASACKNDITKDEEILSKTALQTTMGNPSPNLDWDNLSSFPYGPNNSIPAPWAGGVARAFPNEYLNDYKETDGWQLYFNTFNNISVPTAPYFIIYNKYRGILRIYYYFTPNSSTETANVTFQLSLNGTVRNSSLLNFEQGELIDQTTNATVISKVQNELVYQAGAWYAEEFEIAYDANLKNLEYFTNELQFSMYAVNVGSIDLNGIQKGEIDGTIQVPKQTQSLFGTLLNGAISVGTGGLSTLLSESKIVGNFFSTNPGPIKLDKVKEGLDDATEDSFEAGGKSIFNAALGVLKGDNGGPNYTEQKVNLKLNSSITLTGSLTNSPSGSFAPSVFISGTKNLIESAPDYIPIYDKTMGLFNIIDVPTVFRSINKQATEDPFENYYFVGYELDNSSINFDFNPDIFNSSSGGATYSNLNTEIVVINGDDLENIAANTTIEYLTNSIALTGEQVNLAGSGGPVFISNADAYIRVSFEVIPNDGSPKSHIVKTFKAELI